MATQNEPASQELRRSSAKPGFSFVPWGMRALLNTAPGWPPVAIDPSKPHKWQTRRVMRKQPIGFRRDWDQTIEPGDRYLGFGGSVWRAEESRGRNKRDAGELTKRRMHAPYRLGQLYYAREALVQVGGMAHYECDATELLGVGFAPMVTKDCGATHDFIPWRWEGDRLKEWYMPAEAARLFYILHDIWAHQVQNISTQGAMAEGSPAELDEPSSVTPLHWFRASWDEINGPGAWDRNDYVWVYATQRVEL